VRIIIGSDHAGFALKESIKGFLSSAGVRTFDAGTHRDESVDYPDYGVLAAGRVSSGEFEKGILVCGSGVGMAIVANKFPGVIDMVAATLDEKQKLATLAILCDLAMADGVLAGEEKAILQMYMDKFGVPEVALKPIIEAIAIKNDFSIFS
jgi:RpiB/LacA/LacB family sugar-phosphate isomerase